MLIYTLYCQQFGIYTHTDTMFRILLLYLHEHHCVLAPCHTHASDPAAPLCRRQAT